MAMIGTFQADRSKRIIPRAETGPMTACLTGLYSMLLREQEGKVDTSHS